METNQQSGQFKKAKPKLTQRVGDAIEKFGDKVEHSISKKAGDAIEKLGNKIEHLQDKKGERKPFKKQA